MRKNLVILISVFLFTSVANSQYWINKTNYNYHTYNYQAGDPYNPAVAGLTSFLIPGLGQILSGEPGRGAAFFGGYAGCWVIFGIGYGTSKNDYENGGTGEPGVGAMLLGLFGAIALDICSIVDAVHVAKVNNLVFRDKNKTGSHIQLQPYFNISNYDKTSNIPIGLSFRVRF